MNPKDFEQKSACKRLQVALRDALDGSDKEFRIFFERSRNFGKVFNTKFVHRDSYFAFLPNLRKSLLQLLNHCQWEEHFSAEPVSLQPQLNSILHDLRLAASPGGPIGKMGGHSYGPWNCAAAFLLICDLDDSNSWHLRDFVKHWLPDYENPLDRQSQSKNNVPRRGIWKTCDRLREKIRVAKLHAKQVSRDDGNAVIESSVFYTLARRYDDRLRRSNSGSIARVANPKNILRELLERVEWELDLPKIANEGREIGLAVSRLIGHLRRSQDSQIYNCVAGFLRVGDQAKWGNSIAIGSSISASPPEIPLAIRLLANPEGLASQWVRRILDLSDVPSGASPEQVLSITSNAIKKLDWHETANEFAIELQQCLPDLRKVALEGPNMPQLALCKFPTWMCAAEFLQISPASRSGQDNLDDFAEFVKKWLPELQRDTNSRGSSEGNRHKFNPVDAIDKKDVSTPNSGKTRKVGSRRDNRGHN